MSAVLDIARTYRAPGAVQSRRAHAPGSEGRLYAVLMAGCVLMFAASMPRQMRIANENPELPFEGLLSAQLFVWVFMMPVIYYALAWIARQVARALGGQGTGVTARATLFWAVLAAAPLALLAGLFEGFAGPGPVTHGVRLLWGAAFLVIWIAGMVAVERSGAARAT